MAAAASGKVLMAPSGEVDGGVFECKSACDSCPDTPSGACHECTFAVEPLHTSPSYPDVRAQLRDGVFHHHAADYSSVASEREGEASSGRKQL